MANLNLNFQIIFTSYFFLPRTSTQINTESWLQQPDHSDENEFDEVIENTTSLIGTHDERSEVLHEQDQAYFES